MKILVLLAIFMMITSCIGAPTPVSDAWREKATDWTEKPPERTTTASTGFDKGSWGGIKDTLGQSKQDKGIKSNVGYAASYVDRNIPKLNIRNRDAIAVVIGNKDYYSNDIPSVDFALNDAEIVKQYLINVFGYSEDSILFEPNASKTKFEAIFGTSEDYKGKLYYRLKKNKSDLFIYYSGHGAPETNTKEAFIVPVDADPQAISLTSYSLKLLYENISKIVNERQPRNVFIVIDACFSGATEKGMLLKNISPIFIEVKNPLLALSNTVMMTSSKGTEVSSWYPEKGHSMFTYFFLKAVKDKIAKGDKLITADEIFKLVSDETEGVPYYAGRLHRRIQTPQFIGDRNRVLVDGR